MESREPRKRDFRIRWLVEPDNQHDGGLCGFFPRRRASHGSLLFPQCEVDARGISLGCSCTVRVTLKDGTFREDVGWGSISNAKDKAMAFEKVRKEAATDALKRSLKNFGNALGNCLYDKEYCKMIPKVRGENSGPLDPNNLLRPSDLKDYPQVRTDGLSNRLKSMDEHWDHQHPPPALQPQQAGNPPPPQQPPYAGAPNQPPHLAAAAPNPGYGQQPGMSGPAAYAHPPQGPPPGYGPPMPDAKRTSPPKHAMPAQQPQQQPQQHQQQQQHRLIANNPGPYQAQGAIEPAKTAASTALAPAIGEPEFGEHCLASRLESRAHSLLSTDSFEMDPDISFASDESKEIVAGDLENLQTELLVGVKPVLNQQPAIAQAKSAPPQQSLGAINDAKRARAQAMQREWQERNRSNQNQKQNQNQGSGNEASGNSNGIGWSAESTRTTPPEKAPQPLAVPPAAPFKPAPLAPLKSAAPSAEPNPAEMQTPPTVAFDSQGGDAGFEAKFTSAASMIGGPAAKAPSIPVPAPAPAPQPQPQLVTNENGQPPGLGAVNLNAPLATPRTLRTRRGGGTGSNSLSRGQQAPFKIPGPAAASPSVDRAIKPFSAPGPMIGLSPSKRGVPFGGPGGMGQKRPFDQVN